MANSFEDYQELSDLGFQGGGEAPAPEDDFFHSLYISGKTRKNHINIEEKSGLFQVRGVQYNLSEIYMIITHTKDILCKIKIVQKKDSIECFSYKDGAPPWFGTTAFPNGNKRMCPGNSAERAANDFCNTCKSQIIVAGIFCDKNGSPILTDENKPIFVFMRGKGTRYSNISNYLNDRYNEDLSPIFEPVTDASKQFEKSVVNNKRFVVKITKGTTTTSHGNDVNVFVLEKSEELPKDVVLKILKLSKDTASKFNDKFDWSKKRGGSATGYGNTSAPEGVLEIGEPVDNPNPQTTQESETPKKTFSFDDISF